MNFTPEQLQQISQWVSEGETLAFIQDQIRETFKISMTYMEVRFLIDDLDLELSSPVKDKTDDVVDASDESEDEKAPATQANAELVDEAEDPFADNDALFGSNVKVELSRLTKPGALIHGTVTFSDGEQSEWMLDQFGRLGLTPQKKGYQPSQDDIQAFQQELSTLIQQQGY